MSNEHSRAVVAGVQDQPTVASRADPHWIKETPHCSPGEVLGHYRIQRMLAEGGMGVVFEAVDLDLCRPVALKVLKHLPAFGDNENRQRFMREARTMAAIKSDHLVTVYRVGTEGNRVYLALELLRGETLETRLNQTPPLTTLQIARIGREIALGLAAIHEQGLIHRDIKPTNLWLEEPHGRVKILDFGLVREIKDAMHLTHEGLIVGTPAYLSPEQARGKELDHRTDLFSLGCVLYRACTGVLPFQATDTVSQLVAITTDEPIAVRRLNPNIAPSLARLVHDLLEKNRDDRPLSAEVVAEELRNIEGRDEDTEHVPSTEEAHRPKADTRLPRRGTPRNDPRKQRVSRRFRIRAFIAGAGIVVAMAVGAVLQSGLWGTIAPREQVTSPATVYLTDLPMSETVSWPFQPSPVGPLHGPKRPHVFPKGGEPARQLLPRDNIPMVDEFHTVRVHGHHHAHSFVMHSAPPHMLPASVSYALKGEYRQFMGRITLNDTAPATRAPMVFRVLGDHRILWESQPLSTNEHEQHFAIAVAGIKTLKLTVESHGDIFHSHGVWLEPILGR